MEPLVFTLVASLVATGNLLATRSEIVDLLKEASRYLESTQVQGILKPWLIGKFRNYSLRLNVASGSNMNLASYSIWLFSATPCQCIITKEGFIQQAGKAVMLIKETEIGIFDFDSRYLIKTEQEMPVRVCLSKKACRTVIDEIFSSGFHRLEILDGVIKASKISQDIHSDCGGAGFVPSLKKLIGLAKSL